MLLRTMKRIVCTVFLVLLGVTLWGQQAKQARKVLDQTAEVIKSAGGMRVDFTMIVTKDQRLVDKSEGVLHLQGECFKLETSDLKNWFDGKTQWSYLLVNEEVNVIDPTEEELESINPYRLLLSYQKGFPDVAIGESTLYKNKPIVEVILKNKKKDKEVESVILYVDKTNNLPLYLKIRLWDRTESEIMVKEYIMHQTYSLDFFRFDESEYPSVDIIDLR